MEAAKMFRALIICVLSLSTLKVANCDGSEERHLCRQPVAVSYTEVVPQQLDEFGDFEKYFQKLGISGGNKTVTKTKLEDEWVCCPGYIKSDGGDCEPDQAKTEEPTDATSESSTELTSITSHMDLSSTQTTPDSNQQTPSYLPYLLYTALAITALIICVSVVCFLKTRKLKKSNNGNYEVTFDSEIQKGLINY